MPGPGQPEGIARFSRGRLADCPKTLIMRITQALLAEHVVYHNMFDYLEQTVPGMKTLAEVRAVAALLETLLALHAEAEDELLLEPLEPSFSQMGQDETFHEEHDEIDQGLAQARKAQRLARTKEYLLKTIVLCRNHFDKEERLVFPLAEKLLSVRSQEMLGRRWAKQRKLAVD